MTVSYSGMMAAVTKTQEEAGRLDGQREKIRNISSGIDFMEEMLRTGWSGEAGELFLKKCRDVKRTMEKSVSELRAAALCLQACAKQYQTEQIRLMELEKRQKSEQENTW